MKRIFTILAALLITFGAFSQTYNESSLFYNTNKTYIRLIDNPVHGQLNIQISNPYSEKYDLALYSLTGQKVSEMEFSHPGGVSTKRMYVSDGISGMYFLVARTREGRQSLKVLIQ